jgi:hypothetical protein
MSDNGQEPVVVDAAPPFDATSAPQADVIIRSSDNVDFRVLAAFLAHSSPIFRSMFTLPRGHGKDVDDTKDGLPTVSLPENGKVLYRLLHLGYPICATAASHAAKMHTLPDVRAVLDAALKYEMDDVVTLVRKELIAPQFLEKEPLCVFALSIHYRFENEAKVAATMTRGTRLRLSYGPELETITGGDLIRLQEYHASGADAASKVATDLRWITSSDWIWFECDECKAQRGARMKIIYISEGRRLRVYSGWWLEFMELARKALRKAPMGSTVLERELIKEALVNAISCSGCGPRAITELHDFGELFAAEIERVLSKVC